jgi:hypothetical protein
MLIYMIFCKFIYILNESQSFRMEYEFLRIHLNLNDESQSLYV